MKQLLLICILLCGSAAVFGQSPSVELTTEGLRVTAQRPELRVQKKDVDDKPAALFMAILITDELAADFRATMRAKFKHYVDVSIIIDGVEYEMSLEEFKARISASASDLLSMATPQPVAPKSAAEVTSRYLEIRLNTGEVGRFRAKYQLSGTTYSDIAVYFDKTAYEMTAEEFTSRIVNNKLESQ